MQWTTKNHHHRQHKNHHVFQKIAFMLLLVMLHATIPTSASFASDFSITSFHSTELKRRTSISETTTMFMMPSAPRAATRRFMLSGINNGIVKSTDKGKSLGHGHSTPGANRLSSSTAISLAPTTSALETASIFSTWIGAALLGYVLDQNVLPDSGIKVTLTVSALVCPPSTILSHWCWNTFLPASLALLLLSLGQENNHQSSLTSKSSSSELGIKDQNQDEDSESISNAIQRLTVPFVLACIGSFLGGILTFGLCCYYALPSVAASGSAAAITASSWLLPPNQARIALSCLTAAFIGGSVNFFSTANVIRASYAASKATTTALIGAMATTNLVVMATYFTLLSSTHSSTTLRKLFSFANASTTTREQVPPTEIEMNEALPSNPQVSFVENPVRQSSNRYGIFGKTQAIVVGCSTALVIVRFASWVERQLSCVIPGLSCAVIALLTAGIQHSNSPLPPRWKKWYREGGVPQIARPLSQISLLSLFSCLGSSITESATTLVTTTQVAWLQTGLPCLVVSLLALSVHCFVTMFGSWSWALLQRPWRGKKRHHTVISLDEVLVASNAAVGGPATAAAFCGRMPRTVAVKGLTYAATFWGVVGYAVGTTVGVLTYQLFGWIMTAMKVS